MNRSKAAISSRAPRLISTLVPLESVLRLLELLDLRELAVDWLPWEESVLLEPRERELAWVKELLGMRILRREVIACFGRVLYAGCVCPGPCVK